MFDFLPALFIGGSLIGLATGFYLGIRYQQYKIYTQTEWTFLRWNNNILGFRKIPHAKDRKIYKGENVILGYKVPTSGIGPEGLEIYE